MGRHLYWRAYTSNIRPQACQTHNTGERPEFKQLPLPETTSFASSAAEKQEIFAEALSVLSELSESAKEQPHSPRTTRLIVSETAEHTRRRLSWSETPEDVHVPITNPSELDLLQSLLSLTRKTPADSTQTAEALKALFEEPSHRPLLGVQAYELGLSFCVRVNDLRLLRHLLNLAKQSNVNASQRLCNIVLGSFVNGRDMKGWVATVFSFGEIGFRPTIDTWNQLLSLCDVEQKMAVLERMSHYTHIQPDATTSGIMLPILRSTCSSDHEYLAQLVNIRWTPVLGDVYVGEALRTKDLSIVWHLLQAESFICSIEGLEQLLCHIRLRPAGVFNHRKYTRLICQYMELRSVKPRARTFELLFDLTPKVKRRHFPEMIYRTAEQRGLVSTALKRRWSAYQRQRTNPDTLHGDWKRWTSRS